MLSRMLLAATCLAASAPLLDAQDAAEYVEKTRYPVIEEMRKAAQAQRQAARKKTEQILAEVRKERAAREVKQELRPSMDGVNRPSGPAAFERAWHYDPTPQYRTGTCWSFASTSFLESEMHRLHGKPIKLSEMWTAYWEYVDKARGFLRTRGNTHLGEGSESNAFQRIWKERGVVPRGAFEGCIVAEGRFDHSQLFNHVEAYLQWCQEQNLWDEEFVLEQIRHILDRTMGRPPESFDFNGTTYTPHSFLSDVCQINPDDYVAVMSTMATPFWSYGVFDVPDNWWFDDRYFNVPLDAFMTTFDQALQKGYTVSLGGDVSEPGLYGKYDVAFVPSFDIHPTHIDQAAREHRIANETTTDDHAVHAVGRLEQDGETWYLIKDSNRSSRLGEHEGYYMYRSDYVQLKMLTLLLHRDVAQELLAQGSAPERR